MNTIETPTNARLETETVPQGDPLLMLLEAARGVVNARTWKGHQGYESSLTEAIAELDAAIEPYRGKGLVK